MDKPLAIKPLGSMMKTDKAGFLVSESSVNKIVQPWKAVVDELIDYFGEYFGDKLHSMYVRGSVARGKAIMGISDIDIFVLTKHFVADQSLPSLEALSSDIMAKYPFVTEVDVEFPTVGQVKEDQDYGMDRLLIKYMSACVWGDNVIDQLPSVSVDSSIAFNAMDFEPWLSRRMEQLDGQTGPIPLHRCVWTMKVVLRLAFDLVMVREKGYTRDLYQCYASFSKYYPEAEPLARQALELAVNPTTDRAVVRQLVVEFGDFIKTEIPHVFPHMHKNKLN